MYLRDRNWVGLGAEAWIDSRERNTQPCLSRGDPCLHHSLPHCLGGANKCQDLSNGAPRANNGRACTRGLLIYPSHHYYLAYSLLSSVKIMGNELLLIIGFTTFSLVVTMAWVGGYLDKYQHTLQDILLDKTGENRASYGLKSMFWQRCLRKYLDSVNNY